MASVNWLKATTQKAGAMKKHLGKEERVNGVHSNSDIDKSKSHLNVYIGADDYAPMLEKVKARIEQVDKEHPPKRNQGDRRITCIMLEFAVPQEITEQGKATDFLLDAHRVIEDFFGAENVGGTCGHFDEQHAYIDKDGSEKMSLVHGHTVAAAYAEWTDKKTGEQRVGINGKNCETKARLKALNKAMCDMCREKYGVEYNTGEQAKRKTVEALKAESEIAALRKDVEKLSQERDTKISETISDFVSGKGKKKVAAAEKIVENVEAIIDNAEALNAANVEKDKQLNEREEVIAEHEKEVEEKERQLAVLQREADDKIKTLESEYQRKENTLVAKFKQQLEALTHKLKAMRDALFAAIVQRKSDKLAQAPLPTAAERFFRRDLERSQPSEKGR